MNLDAALQRMWYRPRLGVSGALLLPLTWLFGLLAASRRAAYRAGLLRSVRLDRPVIVIGNITVGGTGKTPFTIWLAQALQRRGKRVGIVLRGYGGQGTTATVVTPQSDWRSVGDEAVLLARSVPAIVVAGSDRVADARKALELGADLVLSDDGLQHYRLARDCEIAVVDAERRFGNGHLLPAGPLREPASRLVRADCVVLMQKGSHTSAPASVGHRLEIPALARLTSVRRIATGEVRDLASFARARVHAVAGIGSPQSFFDALRSAGLEVIPHAMRDHAVLTADDIRFEDAAPVLMTEKDAVRCERIVDDRHWAATMAVELSAMDAESVLTAVGRVTNLTG